MPWQNYTKPTEIPDEQVLIASENLTLIQPQAGFATSHP
jgi:hypothetical protein